jgi:hypothetical protein
MRPININQIIIDPETFPGWNHTGKCIRTIAVGKLIENADHLIQRLSVADFIMIADWKSCFADHLPEGEVYNDETIETGENLGNISFINYAIELIPDVITTPEDQGTLLEITKIKLNLQKLLQRPNVIENPETWTERDHRENARIGHIFCALFKPQKRAVLPLFNRILQSLTLHDIFQLLVIKNVTENSLTYNQATGEISYKERSDVTINNAVKRGINSSSINLVDAIEILRQKYFSDYDIISFNLNALKREWYNINDFVYDAFSDILDRDIFNQWVQTGYFIDTTSIKDFFILTSNIIRDMTLFDVIELSYYTLQHIIFIEGDEESLESDDEYKWGIQLQEITAMQYAHRHYPNPSTVSLKVTLRKLLQPFKDYEYKNTNIEIDIDRVTAIGRIYGKFYRETQEINLISLYTKLLKKISLHDMFQLGIKKGYIAINPEIVAARDIKIAQLRGEPAQQIKVINIIEFLGKEYFIEDNIYAAHEKIKCIQETVFEVFKDRLITEKEMRDKGIF